MKGSDAIVILAIAIIIGICLRNYPSILPEYLRNVLNLKSSSQASYDYDLIIVVAGLSLLFSSFESNKLFKG